MLEDAEEFQDGHHPDADRVVLSTAIGDEAEADGYDPSIKDMAPKRKGKPERIQQIQGAQAVRRQKTSTLKLGRTSNTWSSRWARWTSSSPTERDVYAEQAKSR